RLRPVAEADNDGDEPDRDQRLAGLRLAQRLAEPGSMVLLFDEAEDLFLGRRVAFDEPRTSSRVVIHRLLKRIAVPVRRTANDISVLGPAVLRRDVPGVAGAGSGHADGAVAAPWRDARGGAERCRRGTTRAPSACRAGCCRDSAPGHAARRRRSRNDA